MKKSSARQNTTTLSKPLRRAFQSLYTSPLKGYLAAYLAGATLTLGFAPYRIWPLVLAALVLLLMLWRDAATPKRSLVMGWVFGLGYFSVGINWFIFCARDYGNLPLWVAVTLYLVFINILAAFSAGLGYILKKYYGDFNKNTVLGIFPAVWVIFEWLRSWIFTGFPWLALGYTQIDGPLRGYVPIVGVFGVSWLVLFTAGIMFLFFDKGQNAKNITITTILLAALWITGIALQYVSWTTLDTQAHKVSLIQTNINPAAKPTLSMEDHARLYSPLTIANLDSELIIWPESSLPYFLPYSEGYMHEIAKVAKEHNTTILLGALNSPPELYINDRLYLYNSIYAVGVGAGRYDKQRLVPFAEYLPYEPYFGKILRKLHVDYARGYKGNKKQDILSLPTGTLLPILCYEVAYPETLRARLKQSAAGAIVNMSEDGWFGQRQVLNVNLDFARMRALESGRYVLRAATKGITAIINPQGKIVAASRPYVTDSVRGEFYNAHGFTPWTRFGCPVLISLMVLTVIISTQKFFIIRLRFAKRL